MWTRLILRKYSTEASKFSANLLRKPKVYPFQSKVQLKTSFTKNSAEIPQKNNNSQKL